MITKYEELAAEIIDNVCDIVEIQHPEINLNTDIAKESGITDPAVICGVPYYDLEAYIADKLRAFKKE